MYIIQSVETAILFDVFSYVFSWNRDRRKNEQSVYQSVLSVCAGDMLYLSQQNKYYIKGGGGDWPADERNGQQRVKHPCKCNS